MSSPQMMTMLGLATWASASPGGATNNASNAISTRMIRFIVALQSGSLFEREDLLPVGLHVDDRPAPALGLVECFVQPTDVRRAIVGPLAHVVGVAHDAHEARALAGRCPLKHLLVAVGVAEREERPAADDLLDVHGLARAVVDEGDLRLTEQQGLAVVAELVGGDEARADHLLGRDAVDALRPRAHELDGAARHDVGLEAVRP